MDVRPLDAEPVDRWTVGLCTLDDGRFDVTLDAFIGHRALDIGHWTLFVGGWTLGRRHVARWTPRV